MRRKMRGIISILLATLIVTSCVPAYSYNVGDRVSDEDYGSSYIFHYGAGAVISGVTWYFLDDWNPVARCITSVAAAVLVKTLVESFDEPFDGRDIIDYGIGGIISVTILEVSF